MWTIRIPSTSEYSPGALGWDWTSIEGPQCDSRGEAGNHGCSPALWDLVPISVTQDLLLLRSSLGMMISVPSLPCRSKLTNEDFRKLLMTPRAAPTSAPPSKSRHHE